jgi:error-prone DNA polymerase
LLVVVIMTARNPGYVELRAASAFSFLSAAAHPEDLVSRAAELGQGALALADAHGVYAIPRFVKAARTAGIRPIVGARVRLVPGPEALATSLDRESGVGMRNPPVAAAGASGSEVPVRLPLRAHASRSGARPRSAFDAPRVVEPPSLLLLCRDAAGWRNLCELLTDAHAGCEKGEARVTPAMLERLSGGLVALAGGMDGPILAAARTRGREASRDLLDQLVGTFGAGNVFVDLQRHGDPVQEHGNRFLADLAADCGAGCVATNDVRYATADQAPILDAFTALRHGVTLDVAGGLLPGAHRRAMASADDMARRFADRPAVLRATVELADRLTFQLDDTGYRFPRFESAAGRSEADQLADRVAQGVLDRYRVPSDRVRRQVAHELALIRKLDLAGYFLLVDDLVRFCRARDILAQGRGSAANSIVCYALGITAIDPIAYDLLFERFLSEERDEWPDIDLDLPSGDDREQVIQYVYRRYGERSVGMTAAVISFQGRLAAREMGKVLGLDPARLDRLCRLVGHFEFWDTGEGFAERVVEAGMDPSDTRVACFIDLWNGVRHLPRHLAQHNGGMVIAGGRLDRTVPLEPARMPGRTVIQWDKDDLADLRIIKVDLLGLGMLAAIQDTLGMVRTHQGVAIDLGRLPPDDPAVYAMLRRADTVGVFQVESRAQMATLPRMRPERFYDLVVEVALIRPGPIVGKMVHPYLARRTGREPVVYDDPCLEPILGRTLGIPLFQEQLMRMAMAVAGFSGGQAEELRRAMGSRRSRARMQAMIDDLHRGMAARGIGVAARERIVQSIASFALYGFPESHAASFALIAYASAWLKVHHPAAFFAALLNRWPMGFYHPSTLVRDAERHGVPVRSVDAAVSSWDCTLEAATVPPVRRIVPVDASVAASGAREADLRTDASLAIRLGLKYVKGLTRRTGDALLAARARAPFSGVTDLGRRAGASSAELYALARVGALGPSRRDAMWQALALDADRGLLAGTVPDVPDPAVPPMDVTQRIQADFDGLGLTTGPHPVALLRESLDRLRATLAADVPALPDGRHVRVAGMAIVRQRPRTAKGFVFLTLEDETGLVNLAVTPDRFREHRATLSTEPFLWVDGVVQNREGVVTVRVDRCGALAGAVRHDGRNFH